MRHFRAPRDFRRWLDRNHLRERELVVAFYKAGSGRAGLTYPQALDEALCFGWIDGVRRRIDDDRFSIRFSPRKRGSRWSAVNRRRYAELRKLGRVQPAGEKAFAAGKPSRYSFERRPMRLDPASRRRLEGDARAWAFFQSQPPWYRRVARYWVMSAKRAETRERRLAILIDCSSRGRRIPSVPP